MELVLTYIISWWGVLGLALFAMIETEDNEVFRAFVSLVAVGLATYLMPPVGYWGLPLYFVVGVVWSMVRYRLFVTESLNNSFQSERNNPDAWNNLKNRLSPSKQGSRIASWVLAWPADIVANAWTVLRTLVVAFSRRFLKGLYERMFNSAVDEFNSQK